MKGMWVAQTEGSKFWLSVLTELKNRGVEIIFIACVDGLTGFPEAIETVYPKAKVQWCIVHLLRNSFKYVNWKERKAVAADLKAVYTASTVDEAELALMAFSENGIENSLLSVTYGDEIGSELSPFSATLTDIRNLTNSDSVVIATKLYYHQAHKAAVTAAPLLHQYGL